MSRFRDPQDPLFQALNSSISFDYRLAPYDLEQSLAHARMLARSGIIARRRPGRRSSAAWRRCARRSTRTASSSREDDEDIHMAIERRLTELIGPVGGKLHTARSRNDQVATDVAMLVRAHALDAQALLRELMAHARRAGRAPPRLAAARLHAPAARPAGLPVAPPARLLLEVPARPAALQLLPDRHRRPAARRGRAGRRQLRHQPHVRRAGARLRRDRRELARRRLQPRLRARLPERGRHLRRPPVAARRRDRALVDRGVRLLPGVRLVRVGLEPDAAEEEPRRGRAAARQGAARGRPTWPRSTACCTACRSPTTRTSRRTRSRSSTRSTRSSCACAWRAACWPRSSSTASAWPRPPPTS